MFMMTLHSNRTLAKTYILRRAPVSTPLKNSDFPTRKHVDVTLLRIRKEREPQEQNTNPTKTTPDIRTKNYNISNLRLSTRRKT